MDIRDLTVVSRMRRADELAAVLGCGFERPGVFPDTANILIYGGFYDDLILAERFLSYTGKTVYVLFTGVDICELQDAILGTRNYYYALLEILKGIKVLTVGRRAESELEYLGVKPAGSVVLPVEVDCEPDAERTAVISYVPDDPFYRFLYRTDVVERLAVANKDIELYRTDPVSHFKRAYLNVRLTRHDGQPYDVIALAQMGIQSVVSYLDFPYMVSVADTDNPDIVYGMALNAIKNYKPDAGEIGEMRDYYRERYSAEKARASFELI